MKKSSVARILGCVTVFGLVAWAEPGGFKIRAATPVTILPAQRTLPDGSVVELRNGASIGVEFTPSIRRVTLHDGEADFKVAKDPLRPFVVGVGGVEVQAVGTAFSVSRKKQVIAIAVTEGRVLTSGARGPISAPTSSSVLSSPATLVNAGSGLTVLEFQGTPLAEAVALINQYAPVRLVIRDPSLERLTLTAIAIADNSYALLRLLQEKLSIQTEDHGRETWLRR